MLTGFVDVAVVENGRKVAIPRQRTAAAGCLDEPSADVAFTADAVWLRVYENKAMPEPEWYAEAGVIFATAHRRPGQRVCLVGGNEPNLSFEGWHTDPAGYRAWFGRWRAKVKSLDPSLECWWAGMSPGAGPQRWYVGCEDADGAVLHLYGLSVDELMLTARAWRLLHAGVPWMVGECNYGPGLGRRCDRDRWAEDVLTPSLAESQRLGCEAVLYFPYAGWTQDDSSVGQETALDARGTAIDTVLRAWRDPAQPPPAARNEPNSSTLPVVPATPTRESPMIKGIDISNNNGVVDLARAKAAGYSFVVVKLSEDELGEDDFFDTFAGANLAAARALELGVGVYTFIRPSRSSPAESITLIERALARVGGLRAGEFVALDCEDETYQGDLHVWLAEALALGAQALGQPLWKYSADWYTSTRNLEHADLAPFPTWWASYQDKLPDPQTGWGPIRMWQNGVVGPGAVPGVVGQCDVNVFFGTLEELRATGKPADAEPASPPPVEQPPPAPRPPDMVTAALDNVFDLTLSDGPNPEARRISAQAAIGVLKDALNRRVA